MWISLATANVFISSIISNYPNSEPIIVEFQNDTLTGNLRAELVDTFQPTTFHRTVDR